VHAGKLGLNEITGRSTHGLLQGLASFFKVEEAARSVTKFTFMGPKDDATEALGKKLDLDGVMRFLGSVNYEESLRHIRSATVCVLVEADVAEGIYLPSKLADYIVAKKPILALSPSVGVLSDMIPRGGIIRVSPNDETSISEAIGKLYKAFLNRSLHEYMPPNQLIRQFEAGPIAEKFLSVVSQVIENKSRVAKR
jgi:hypothetical protein